MLQARVRMGMREGETGSHCCRAVGHKEEKGEGRRQTTGNRSHRDGNCSSVEAGEALGGSAEGRGRARWVEVSPDVRARRVRMLGQGFTGAVTS